MSAQTSGRSVVIRQANRWLQWFIVILIGPQALIALKMANSLWPSQPDRALICAGIALVGCVISYLAIRKIAHRGPAFTLTPKGLIAHASGPDVLPWHAVKEIRIISGRYASILVTFHRDRLPQRVRDTTFNWLEPSDRFSVSARGMNITMPLGAFAALVADHWEAALKERDSSLSVAEEYSLLSGRRFLPARNGRPLTA